jgi:catechol 2,3-dioxygenase-like lactoylglutathione lyase family enzyme
MLEGFTPHTTLPVTDLERAKAWYKEKLGFTPTSEDPGGAWYESGGATFALFPTQFAGTAQNTAMEWSVDGIRGVIDELKGRGVAFDHYDLPGVEWDGDIAVMGPYKGAWFKDSEGNILALTERLDS